MIEYRDPKKNIWLKAITWFLVVTFLWYDIAWAGDLFYISNSFAATDTSTPKSSPIINYDLLGYNKHNSSSNSLLPTSQEKEESNAFSPAYVQEQQAKHEDIIKQKQNTEDQTLMMKNAPKREDEDITLQKKRSSGSGGGGRLSYTIQDFGTNGLPRQLNVYVYGRDGRLTDINTYDISKDGGLWKSGTQEIKDKNGDNLFGSYKQLNPDAVPVGDALISKTVYSGSKGNEKIDYILSDFDVNNVATSVTESNYASAGNLDKTQTYNITNLGLDFTTEDWRGKLSDNRLTQTAVYTGSAGNEQVSYVLDTYLVSDFGTNDPNACCR